MDIHFRVVEEASVKGEDVQEVQVLAFIFMEVFDLDIVDGIRGGAEPK